LAVRLAKHAGRSNCGKNPSGAVIFGASSRGSILNGFLIAILSGAIVLILGRLHSYYLDENERIAKGLRTLGD
jgi:hypothetical protein